MTLEEHLARDSAPAPIRAYRKGELIAVPGGLVRVKRDRGNSLEVRGINGLKWTGGNLRKSELRESK